MYALAILSFDSDLSKNDQKTVWLIEMHRLLLQAMKNHFEPDLATLETKAAVALYFENLKRLSEETKKTILGNLRLPRVKARQPSEPSDTHKRISALMRRNFAENKKDFIVVDEESGLESEILPMDITIKDGTGKRIISFIEIDGPDHFITLEDGQKIPQRRDQLREELYKFNHPGVPVMRINLLEQQRMTSLNRHDSKHLLYRGKVL
jgi:hypothetical protein